MNILATLTQSADPAGGTDFRWVFTYVLLPIAAWLAAQVFPIVRKWLEGQLRVQEETRKHRMALDERTTNAIEAIASVQEQLGRTISVMQFQISVIERHLGVNKPTRRSTGRPRMKKDDTARDDTTDNHRNAGRSDT